MLGRERAYLVQKKLAFVKYLVRAPFLLFFFHFQMPVVADGIRALSFAFHLLTFDT